MRMRDIIVIVLAIGLIGFGAMSSLLSMRGTARRAALYERVVSETDGASERLRQMAAERIQHNTPTERLGPRIQPPEGQETIDSKFWALFKTRPQELEILCTPESSQSAEDRAWIAQMRALATEFRDMLTAEPFPDLSEDDFASAAYLLQDHACQSLAAGDSDAALEDLTLIGALMPRCVQQHPVVGYVHSSLSSVYIGILRALLARQAPSGDALRACISPLDNMNFLTNYPDHFANKKLQAVMMFKDWEDTGFVESVESSGVYWGTRNWLWTNAAGPLYSRDVETYMDYCDQLHAATTIPYPEAAPTLARLRKELAELGPTYNDTRMLAYELRRYDASVTRQQESRLIALAGQIVLAHETTGAYPQSLDTLGPETAPKRLDLFTGKALHYQPRPDGSGFRLTSAGPDGFHPSNDDVILPWPLPDPCGPTLAKPASSWR